MVQLIQIIAYAGLWGLAYSNSIDKLSAKKTFSLEESSFQCTIRQSGLHAMRSDYIKHGLDVPQKLQEAVDKASVPGRTSVAATPVSGDREYNIKVQIGIRNFTLELDTGSSDLQVFPLLRLQGGCELIESYN
jgi:hypothetical protein